MALQENVWVTLLHDGFGVMTWARDVRHLEPVKRRTKGQFKAQR